MRTLYFLLLSSLVALTLFAADDHTELSVIENLQPITAIESTSIASYADVLDRATPSVVAVYTSQRVRPYNYNRRIPRSIQDILRQFGRSMPPTVQEPEERLERVGVGSGVIISKDGYIVTNHHVIKVQRGQIADEIRVLLCDGTEYVARLVGSDEKTDVAVLKIEPDEALPAITIADSSLLRVGDIVFAIGNPLDVGLTATQGIVSALGRDSSGILGPGAYENFIQTDAAINLGNSGGALIDAAGRLVGINTAIVSSSGGSIGIGFAIPSNMALNVAHNLVERGTVPRGLLGLAPVNLNSELAEAFNLPSTRGALVNQVQPDSPADKGGIRHGDVIIEVNNKAIESAQQLRLIISQMQPGSEVDVKLIRQSETLVLPVILGSLNRPLPSVDSNQNILEGILLEALSSVMREDWSIPQNVKGVVVSNVNPGSPYSGVMEAGTVIQEVNGHAVVTPIDIANQLRQGANRFYIWRDRTNYFIVIYIQE